MSSPRIKEDDVRPDDTEKKNDEEAQLLNQLKAAGYEPYLFQEDLTFQTPRGEYVIPKEFTSMFAWQIKQYKDRGFPIVPGKDLGSVKHYSYDDLEQITDSFSKRNFMFKAYNGRLFRGTIQSHNDVVVKTWDFFFPLRVGYGFHTQRMHDELAFLRDQEIQSHPNVVKLIGYHCERRLAVIYSCGIQPKYYLQELIESDVFGWEHRMKMAAEIGSLLKLFHDKGIVHGGIDSSCVILDEQFRWKCFDFQKYAFGYSITEAKRSVDHDEQNLWSIREDIFAYGLLLLGLASRQASLAVFWTWVNHWRSTKPTFVVHESFSISEYTAEEITGLGFDCLRVKEPDAELTIHDALNRLSEIPCTPPLKKQKLHD